MNLWQAVSESLSLSKLIAPAVNFDSATSCWLTRIADSWAGSVGPASRKADLFRDLHSQSSLLSLGTPLGLRRRGFELEPWLGLRFYWWPDGLPPNPGVWLGLACSRLGRRKDRFLAWFRHVEQRIRNLRRSCDLVISCSRTSMAEASLVSADRNGVDVLTVELHDRWTSWGREVRSLPSTQQKGRRLHVSPPIGPDIELAVPGRDRALQSLCSQLIVGPRRKSGNLAQSMRWAHRLNLDNQLLGLWCPPTNPPTRPPTQPQPAHAALPCPTTVIPQHVSDLSIDRPRLQHWTRRRDGPWPDQDRDEYWNDLLLSRNGADHSPLAALTRIIIERRIRGGTRTVSGNQRVVSFTSVPLNSFRNRRQYRAHRQRWDFELYGISLDIEALRRLGAREVTYGSELGESDPLYFQRVESIDWTLESEWRILGDVDLSELATHHVSVFVASAEEALQLSAVSPWPVFFLEPRN